MQRMFDHLNEGFGCECYNINKSHAKNQVDLKYLISNQEDFIRDCRQSRDHERRERTMYEMPPIEEAETLALPDYHPLFPISHHYSIEDFIQNLQTQELIYYNDPQDTLLPSPRVPSIEQINHQYQQRMAEYSPSPKPTSNNSKCSNVKFERELRAKYFRQEDQAIIIGESQEYVCDCEDEQGGSGLEFL